MGCGGVCMCVCVREEVNSATTRKCFNYHTLWQTDKQEKTHIAGVIWINERVYLKGFSCFTEKKGSINKTMEREF